MDILSVIIIGIVQGLYLGSVFLARVERGAADPIAFALNFVQIFQLSCYLVAAHRVLRTYEFLR
jgi:hypothetical protein